MKEYKEYKPIMNVKEFAKAYGLGYNKAYQLVHTKGFPMFKCGRKIIIITSKVDEFLENCIGKEF